MSATDSTGTPAAPEPDPNLIQQAERGAVWNAQNNGDDDQETDLGQAKTLGVVARWASRR